MIQGHFAAEIAHRQGIEQAVGGLFIVALKQLLADSALFGGACQQFFVIKAIPSSLATRLPISRPPLPNCRPNVMIIRSLMFCPPLLHLFFFPMAYGLE